LTTSKVARADDPTGLDRCEAMHGVTRVGLICRGRRLIGDTPPGGSWARRHEAERDGAEQRALGQLVGSGIRMRARCSITRAPTLIRRFRMVANSALARAGLWDRGAHAMHQPERGGVENEPHLASRGEVLGLLEKGLEF
jgi:hypothetical protein